MSSTCGGPTRAGGTTGAAQAAPFPACQKDVHLVSRFLTSPTRLGYLFYVQAFFHEAPGGVHVFPGRSFLVSLGIAVRACGLLLLASVAGGCMTWQPRWPQTGAGTKAEAGAADRLAAEAGRLRAAADTREGLEAAAEACRRVLAVDPGDNGSHLALAHLHLLLGDAYSIRVADKRANFRRAMEHAESAMFANAGFRERVQRGEPTWEAVQALGENEMEAMLHWVNAVFYLFKEGQPHAAQVFNLRWVRRARAVMERMSAVAPDWNGGAVHFVWGLYYLSLPELAGGDRARSAACFEKAIELGPDLLIYRWGRGKYYQVKMRNARGFEEDLRWVISRDPRSSPGEYAWNAFFVQDARRLLALQARLFTEGGTP